MTHFAAFRKTLKSPPVVGFSLVEMLIALLLLGILAAFSIPALLQNPQSQTTKYSNNANAVRWMIMGAYQSLKSSGGLSTTTSGSDIVAYMNYLKRDTATTIDTVSTTITCNSGVQYCVRLHNGGMMRTRTDWTFGEANPDNFICFAFDPDGAAGGYGVVEFDLHYDGRIVLASNRVGTDETYQNGNPLTFGTNPVSSWFTPDS